MKTNFELKLDYIRQHINENNSYQTGNFYDYRLSTAFQPIYSLAHKRHIGFEALVRVKDTASQRIGPANLFQRNKSPGDHIFLDRLCRCIHLNNFSFLKDDINWLFLNVSPETIIQGKAYGAYFKDLIDHAGFPAHRIVIEVVESPIEDNELLMETINYYKHLGCLIAIDDFGAGHSNFNRIWTLKPDIVKLDRSFLIKAATQKNIQDILPGIVSLLHQAGALVLMEGIETENEAMVAIESNVDFVQGFYFGMPFTELHPGFDRFQDFERLFDLAKTRFLAYENKFREKIDQYNSKFKQVAGFLRQGLPLSEASSCLFDELDIVRCYQIGVNGIQIGKTILSKKYACRQSQRFKPLEDANSADWFRRHYLRRAIFHPEQLQVTRPYLSITGAHMCVTLSMKFSGRQGDSVICCDLAV